MSAKPQPFNFDDLREMLTPTAQPSAPAVAYNADDLENARNEGVVEGRRLAMETIAAEDASSLARLGDLIAEARDRHLQTLGDERTMLRAAAAEFLTEICGTICTAREVDVAADLLDRIAENLEDRSPAQLLVNPRTLDRLGARINALIADRGLADFITLAADPALDPGEAKLAWRGGDVRRTRAEIAAAAAAFTETLNAVEKEAQS